MSDTDSNIDPIKIAFLGPTGVGKTSVLAAMSEIMEEQTQAARVELTFKAETFPRLEQAIFELQERCFRPNMRSRGNIAKVEYDLEVQPTALGGWIPGLSIPVQITDYPGEWLRDTEKVRDVKDTIGQASIVMVAIDTVGLMLSKDRDLAFVNRSNATKQVTNVLRESIASAPAGEPKLLVFVPVRCEKWMRNKKDREALLKRLKEVFADVIDLFAQPKLHDRIAIVIAPVKTLGVVEFLKLGPKRKKPELDMDDEGNEIIPNGPFTPGNYDAYYHRVTESKAPKPEFADHLLRYALAFTMVLLKRRTDKEIQDGVNEIKEKFLRELASDNDSALGKWIVKNIGGAVADVPAKGAVWVAQKLVNWPTNSALANFADGRQENLPFEIVQGRHLLVKEQ